MASDVVPGDPVVTADRWRDLALSYEARARFLREQGDLEFAEEYERAALGWREGADALEFGGAA